MSASTQSLDALRARIDAIDDQLHDLLMQRTAIVEGIAEAKKGEGGIAALRPGREAAILRRLSERHRGPFPVGAVLRIWRELIAGQLSVQTRFAVAVFMPSRAAGYWDLARDHFGSHTPMSAYRSIGQVVRAVTDGSGTVGVLPMPQEGEEDPWWRGLAGLDEATPRVFARLPFGARGNARAEGGDALAVGRVVPEATGVDRSLLVLESAGGISRARLFSILAGCGLPCTFFAGSQARADVGLDLIEVEGFVTADDERVKSFLDQVGQTVSRVLPIGAYAVPLASAAA
jgi:chorismate mutase/prephenate dehydratase